MEKVTKKKKKKCKDGCSSSCFCCFPYQKMCKKLLNHSREWTGPYLFATVIVRINGHVQITGFCCFCSHMQKSAINYLTYTSMKSFLGKLRSINCWMAENQRESLTSQLVHGDSVCSQFTSYSYLFLKFNRENLSERQIKLQKSFFSNKILQIPPSSHLMKKKMNHRYPYNQSLYCVQI